MDFLLLAQIWYYATINGLDPNLVQSIVEVESSYRPHVTGGDGEIGLMQMKPYYLPGPLTHKLYEAETNLAIGCQELAKLKRLKPQLGDYWFVAWNLGPTGALRYSKRNDISRFAYAQKVGEKYPKYKEKPNLDVKVYVAYNY